MAKTKYTDEQKEVINFKDGNLQIIACAGSGKTTSISARIARLIEKDVKPENIVAFTFTEKAAEVMKHKINQYVSELSSPPGDIGAMYVGTIHSYCFELLKKYNPQYQGYDVLDDNKRVIFLKRYFWKLGLNNRELIHRTWYTADYSWSTIYNALKQIDIVREEKIPINKVKNMEFKHLFIVYEKLLKEKRLLDFSSMMSKTVEMLENDFNTLNEVRKEIGYLICDEYQDINPLQERLIELISMKQNVCVVGDDDQSIYQWRGTKVKNILTFSKRYSKVKSISLVKNFRSSPGVIHHGNHLISKFPDYKRLPKAMEWGNKKERQYEKGDIYSIYFPNQSDELDHVIEKIKNLYGTEFSENGIKRAIDWRDFALIFRSVAYHAKPIIQRLKEEEIPFIVKGSIGLFDREEVQFILSMLAFILDNKTIITYNLDQEDAQTTFLDLFNQKKPDFNKFTKNINKLKEEISKKKFINLQLVFQQLLNVLGVDQHPLKSEIMYNLGQLSMVISDYEGQYYPIKNKQESIQYFFDFLTQHASYSYEEGGHDEKYGGVNAISILTMHRCKGLEFPVVFLPSFTRNAFPKYRRDDTTWFIDSNQIDRDSYKTSEDSQRRLLYVALTRSMKYLFISSSMRMPNYSRQQLPSEFLGDLADNMIIRKSVVDPTKRKKCKNFEAPPNEVFPTNISELGYYYDCPNDYQLRNIFGFNPIIVPFLGYGKSIHNVLNHVHKCKQRNEKIEFDKIFDENFHLRFADDKNKELGKKTAKKIITRYLQNYKEDLELSLETEKPFEMSLGNALISGQIDLLRKKTEKGEEIIIIDFKTEKEPDEYRKNKHKDQITLYGLAYSLSFGMKPESLYIHYLDKKGSRTKVEVSEDNINKLVKKIKNTVDYIRGWNFPRKPHSTSRCKKCDFKLICKGAC